MLSIDQIADIGLSDTTDDDYQSLFRDYDFYGAAQDFMNYDGHEAIIAGPFETGKTIVALQRIHEVLANNDNAQGLAVRQTYKSLLSSAMVTYENKILPYPSSHPDCPVKAYGGRKPEWYDYPNGSRLLLGGMDVPDKFLSAEFDIIYVNQAEEIMLNDWELLTGRASGRAGHVDKPQIIGDCNPSFPTHWILKRKSIKLFHSRHKDNPALFNPATGEITEQGELTMSVLNRLTGMRRKKGLEGLWVQAEGVIFDNFDLEHNVTTEAEYNPNLPLRWGVDDGYVFGDGPGNANYHPRVILFGQQTSQGGVNVFAEYVKAQELSEVTLDNVLALPYPKPELACVDSSATQLRARIGEYGIMNAGSTHKVSQGIKFVRELLCDGQNVRLLKIHPRCQHLIRELQSYRYDTNSKVVEAGEPKPLKQDDHCCDALRYMVWSWRR